jgi:membrane protein implicated in regulation of membrane protease activity
MFFLNFSAASVICAFLGIFIDNYNVLIPTFAVLWIIFILFLRPLLDINPRKQKEDKFESQYVGKLATATSHISAFSGRLKIYDEDWEARTLSEDTPEIKSGSKVKVIRHNDLTMFVEKKGKK